MRLGSSAAAGVRGRIGAAVVGLAALAAPAGAARAATITINNVDAAGEGFNDTTAVSPVGGNAGTTLGQQRLNVFKKAAQLWGDALESVPPVIVEASFKALPCDMNQIVLGQAGPTTFKPRSSGLPTTTWVPIALANALAGSDLNGTEPEIQSEFNGGLDSCTMNQRWYYGVDGNAGDDIDLLSVVLHEFGHGLGFTSTVDPRDGIVDSYPDVFIQHVYDNGTKKSWADMTDDERLASAMSARHLVWDGMNVARQAPQILAGGSPTLSATPAVSGLFGRVSEAEFGVYVSAKSASGPLKFVTVSPMYCDISDSLTGAIAMVDEPTCPGVAMAYYAQKKGAVGVLVVDRIGADPPYSVSMLPSLRDRFPVTIPVVGLSMHDASLLSKAAAGTSVMLSAVADQRVGMDASGRTDLFASNPVQGLSTLAHWDPLVRPDLLLEPEIASKAPHDMRMELAAFRDIGWHTVCGNGKMDPGEQCDLGADNGAAGVACNADCTPATGGSGTGGTMGSGGGPGTGGAPGTGGVTMTGAGGSPMTGSGGDMMVGSGGAPATGSGGGPGTGSGGAAGSGSMTNPDGGSDAPGAGGGGGGGCQMVPDAARTSTVASLVAVAGSLAGLAGLALRRRPRAQLALGASMRSQRRRGRRQAAQTSSTRRT